MFGSVRFRFGKQNFDWLVLFCSSRTVKHCFGRSLPCNTYIHILCKSKCISILLLGNISTTFAKIQITLNRQWNQSSFKKSTRNEFCLLEIKFTLYFGSIFERIVWKFRLQMKTFGLRNRYDVGKLGEYWIEWEIKIYGLESGI